MEFESLPTTPWAEELLDTAFSRAARTGRAKSGVDAQRSMLQTASNVLSDNLEHVVTSWPDFDTIEPFYYDLADAIVADLKGTKTGGIDTLRQHLSEIGWAARKTKDLGREYQRKVGGKDPAAARSIRKQGFARMASVVEEVAEDLRMVGEAREALRQLPDIRANEPTIVVAGYPNVGKSSFLNAVTNARVETAEYPFTTTGVHVGHVEHHYVRYQLVDTPGLLDRPMDERNEIERQAISAISHVADCIVFLVDASETCGYPLEDQLALRDEIVARFEVPVLVVGNKADLSKEVTADYLMSVSTGEGLDAVLEAAIEAVDYEPPLPSDERPPGD